MSMLSARLRTALAGYGPRPAIEDAGENWRLTGEQLAAAAAALNQALAPHAGRPLVAWMNKGPLYYTFLACAFLYGLDFCPLDAENPVQRVVDIAAQLEGSVILCDSEEALARCRALNGRCCRIDMPADAPGRPEIEPHRDACYYIATSGSTGVPKLVQVRHDRTMAFLDWAIPFYGVDDHVRWGQFSSIGFDLSLADFLTVVCGGGVLVALSAQIDRLRPARAVARARLTHWHSVPSMIPYFLQEFMQKTPSAADTACRLFTFCGEPFLRADAEALAKCYPGARIINTYGPTEATLFCSFHEYRPEMEDAAEPTLPIGQALPSWNFVSMPEAGDLRLIILSDNIGEGYVNAPSPQFTTVALFGREMRAFDTGDYVRQAGTQLYFSHRKDTMVKINGLRIDLGEIEAVARRCGFLNPVAMVADNRIALAAEGGSDGAANVQAMARYLPRASLPATVRLVASHPRTISGKVDRRGIRGAFDRANVG